MKKRKLNQGRGSNIFNVHINQANILDDGEGIVRFKKPLTITDDTEQLNGTRYDIESMDISEYDGMLTANHSMNIQEIIGKTFGIKKNKNKVTIDGIKFALKENALARFAYNMMLGGFLTDFSIETIGPWPDDDGIYFNSKLVGLSAVVTGNNKSASVNELVKNSIKQAKKDGLDTSKLEDELGLDNINNKHDNSSMKFKTVKNNRDFSIVVSFKNSAGEDVEVELKAGMSIDVPVKQAKAVRSQIESAESPKEDVDKIVANAISPLMEKIEKLESDLFDKNAKEPEFKKVSNKKITSELDGLNWRERHGKQINYAWDYLKGGNADAGRKLEDINKFHLEKLQEAEIVSNAVTLADFGNFVISPELLTEIEGHRSDFSSLISRLDYRETLSLQMAWLKRSGDIDMTEVEMCDDDADGNLKPISEYGADINTANLHELAAVTPVCNAATRFLAADLLGDVAAGYRNDYDRKRAQLFIARLQQAVDSTGNVVTYSTDTDSNALKSFINAWSHMAEEIENGVFIFNTRTYGELLRRAVGAGISGPLAGVFTTGDQPMIVGRPYIVVPNELLPDLNTANTKTFIVEGTSVSISHAVFYTDLSTFTGRTSGGLQYDLSTEAAYEVDSVVKSAFQRNELVLRGSFFRNGAVKDEDKVVAMGAPGVS